eukprot:40528-Rhodomonas_salina.1
MKRNYFVDSAQVRTKEPDFGIPRVHKAIKERNPLWAISKDRVRRVMQDQGLVYGAALQKPSQDQGLKLLTNTGSESQQVCGSAERNEGIAARLKQINGELKKIGAHMDESGILVRKEALELEREDLKATINPKGLLQEICPSKKDMPAYQKQGLPEPRYETTQEGTSKDGRLSFTATSYDGEEKVIGAGSGNTKKDAVALRPKPSANFLIPAPCSLLLSVTPDVLSSFACGAQEMQAAADALRRRKQPGSAE